MAFAFTPATGLLDIPTYPTDPANETAARQQIQDPLNQIRDYINSKVWGDESTSTRSGFRAYQSVAQAIASGVFTKLLYQTKVFDRLTEYDPTTSRLTALKSGTYLISAGILLPNTTPDGTKAFLGVYVNGARHTDIFQSATGKTDFFVPIGSTQITINAGDYVEIYVLITSGLTTDLSSPSASYFSGTRIA